MNSREYRFKKKGKRVKLEFHGDYIYLELWNSDSETNREDMLDQCIEADEWMKEHGFKVRKVK